MGQNLIGLIKIEKEDIWDADKFIIKTELFVNTEINQGNTVRTEVNTLRLIKKKDTAHYWN